MVKIPSIRTLFFVMFFIGGNDGSEPVAMISESYSFSIISSFSSFAVIVLFFISMDVIVVFK